MDGVNNSHQSSEAFAFAKNAVSRAVDDKTHLQASSRALVNHAIADLAQKAIKLPAGDATKIKIEKKIIKLETTLNNLKDHKIETSKDATKFRKLTNQAIKSSGIKINTTMLKFDERSFKKSLESSNKLVLSIFATQKPAKHRIQSFFQKVFTPKLKLSDMSNRLNSLEPSPSPEKEVIKSLNPTSNHQERTFKRDMENIDHRTVNGKVEYRSINKRVEGDELALEKHEQIPYLLEKSTKSVKTIERKLKDFSGLSSSTELKDLENTKKSYLKVLSSCRATGINLENALIEKSNLTKAETNSIKELLTKVNSYREIIDKELSTLKMNLGQRIQERDDALDAEAEAEAEARRARDEF